MVTVDGLQTRRVVGAVAVGGGVALPHQHPAPEVADLLAVLVEALRLDRDTPRSGFDDDSFTSSTRVSAWIVSPWNVGNLCCSVSTSRLAIAAPLTSGTLIPSTSE